MLELQLINNTVGTIWCGTRHNNPAPEGLIDLELELNRSKNSEGIFHEFTTKLRFNKATRGFIQQVYENEGIDGVIKANLWEYLPNTHDRELMFVGQVKMEAYQIDELTIESNIEQEGFEITFQNQAKKDVTLTDLITVPLAPKKVRQKGIMEGVGEDNLSSFVDGNYRQLRVGTSKSNSDFEKFFMNSDIWIISGAPIANPNDVKNYIIEAEVGGDYTIDINIDVDNSIRVGNYVEPDFDVVINLRWQRLKLMYQKNTGTPVEIYNQQLVVGNDNPAAPLPGDYDTATIQGNGTILYTKNISITYTINETLQAGDEIYLWWDSFTDHPADNDISSNETNIKHNNSSKVEITGETEFPSTNCEGLLIYEVLEQIVKDYTGETTPFYSDYFGRTDIGYASDGEGALNMITNGAKIRGLDKSIFANWQDVYESLNAIYCLGWGFDQVNGEKVVRVEPITHFYDGINASVSLGSVAEGLKKTAKRDEYKKSVEVGYPEVENINQVNGIDEFNTIRRFTSPVTKAKGELKIVSVLRASGFEIESQRRLFGSTKESKLDDKNFIINLKRDGFGGYEVKQGDQFTGVTGVFDPDSAYNLGIRPAVMIRNWQQVLAADIIRSSDKVFKFTYGEHNYELAVDGISEKDNLDLSAVDPLWYNEDYDFEVELSRDERELIRANPKRYIEFLDWNNTKRKGYLMNVKNKIEEKKGKFILRRVYGAN